MIQLGYKLMRRMGDGYAPLYFCRSHRYQLGDWQEAVDGGRKRGYAHRPFFHICQAPDAPHIRLRAPRVWLLCEFQPHQVFPRPSSQGGDWFLAKWMRLLREVAL
ncbi:hypothetical protein LRF89_06695 [Halorhodospira sp. 9621]|uniref:hypothetical protein n=1 Tax=Halorhodospira TaxID=85108 RepID=UPI001EE91AA8|nr:MULTISPECIES: hypothetical protein [Halorhodospira]MCG5526868.1 hypothetical protein [Halorhodospira halophila]MCG5533129.1 hypothetical protein [Halorhodospira sp. 9621]MCG5537884.1 hypothetical protein [Halorhodospira sp. 9622]MCG5542795.1 hypothetical protein [Halorhodospira sp. 9628]